MTVDIERVLSRLDRAPWEKLQPAYGSAADVPALIRALTSPDGKTRNDAWYELRGNLWHQGTIYEATAHVVPILLELLRVDSVPDRHEIIIYLARLFIGRSYWDVHQNSANSRHEVSKPEFPETLRRELSWVETTRQAVRAGKDIYIGLLRTNNRGLQPAAAYLLGLIGEDESEVLEAIAECSEQ